MTTKSKYRKTEKSALLFTQSKDSSFTEKYFKSMFRKKFESKLIVNSLISLKNNNVALR